MKKKVDLQNDHKGVSTTAFIALGTKGEIGIRGDIRYTSKGDLIVEYYNCSADLYEALSSEYCDTTLVSKNDKSLVGEAIRNEVTTSGEDDEDWLILRFLQNTFKDDDEVCQWLLSHHIPYRKFSDSNWGTFPQAPGVDDAEQLARVAHAGQKDRAGADYIEHPLRVSKSFLVEEVPVDDSELRSKIDKLRIVGLLHDVIEDTWVTGEYLERSGYEREVVEAIEALTKLPDEEGSDEGYMRFVKRASQNPLSKQVKIADLKDNMELTRISQPTVKDCQRIEKYKRALAILEN